MHIIQMRRILEHENKIFFGKIGISDHILHMRSLVFQNNMLDIVVSLSNDLSFISTTFAIHWYWWTTWLNRLILRKSSFCVKDWWNHVEIYWNDLLEVNSHQCDIWVKFCAHLFLWVFFFHILMRTIINWLAFLVISKLEQV